MPAATLFPPAGGTRPRANCTLSGLCCARLAEELNHSSAETHLTLRHLRLGPVQARELGETLSKLVDEAEENTEDQPAHGVLVALYQQALPTSTSTSSSA
ncbi:hypothetical protein [Streptomyces sp. NPDC001307]|uniref:hypothetical protein n=1 Tax=Streptomyces sp. NPDC001307 TaxID=3364560 RepID=UPI0036BD49A0